MASRSNGIVLLLVGGLALIVCCVILVGRPSPDKTDIHNLGVPGSTATGEAMPGTTTVGHVPPK